MRGGGSLTLALCVLGISMSPVLAQPDADEQPLPKDPGALVALMAGEHLPSATMKRRSCTSVGCRAAGALRSMKDEAVPALAKGLQSADRSIRINVVFVLARIDTAATVPVRIKAADDADAEVRALAVASLPTYTNEDARRVVIKAVKDPDAKVRIAAVEAFQPRYGEKRPDNGICFATANLLVPLLDDPQMQYSLATTLRHLGSNVAARPLLKLLKSDDANVRHAALEALGELKDKQVTMGLTAALSHLDRHDRRYAAHALGQIGDLRATPALVQALADEESSVRHAAATALGQIGDLRAVPGLIHVLNDAEKYIRSAAAEALGLIGDSRAVEPLCKQLAGADRDNAAAARALGRLHDSRAIEPLTSCLLNGGISYEGARAAADALAKIRHPDAVVALVKVVLNTRDSDIRHHARNALGDATGRSFSFDPDETIASWWKENGQDYVAPIPEKK